MVVLLSLLAATGYALGTVLQQKGNLQDVRDAGDAGGVGFLARLLANPVWLLGGLVTAVGAALQAVALHFGSLAAVQALVTLSLVIALPFGAWLTDQRITRLVWLAACSIVVGVVLFVVVGAPQGGNGAPGAAEWLTAGLWTLGLVGILGWTGRARAGGAQAVLFGAAAGLGFGMASAIAKSFTAVVGHGLVAVLSSWQLYAMLAAGLIGLFLGQSALRTGALAPAMAATNAVSLLASIWLGVTVFGEHLHHGGGRLVVVLVGLALTLGGVAVLARAPAAEPGGPPTPAVPTSRART